MLSQGQRDFIGKCNNASVTTYYLDDLGTCCTHCCSSSLSPTLWLERYWAWSTAPTVLDRDCDRTFAGYGLAIAVPIDPADQLYNLRMHIELVRQKVRQAQTKLEL